MPTTELTTTDPERRRNGPIAHLNRRMSPKTRAAIHAMVWDGLKRNEAAAKAGITDHALYCVLRTPHVRAYYLAELEVLRTSERARNIHRLTEIRDAADNMPAVQAIKTLEQLGDEQPTGGPGRSPAMPGVVIVVQQMAQLPDNADKPLINQDLSSDRL